MNLEKAKKFFTDRLNSLSLYISIFGILSVLIIPSTISLIVFSTIMIFGDEFMENIINFFKTRLKKTLNK